MKAPETIRPVSYWQKPDETIGNEALSLLQLEQLRKSLRQVYKNVPFYHARCDEAGLDPENIKSLEDIRRLSFTTSDDLRANYPFGLLAVSKDEVVRVHTSSGTTGKPKAICFSRNDIDCTANLIARCLVMTGTGRGDTLQNMMTYGLFTGALVMHYGAEKVGALVIPAGPGNTDRQISLMRDFGTTVLHITPSYSLYLASALQAEGDRSAQRSESQKGLSWCGAVFGRDTKKDRRYIRDRCLQFLRIDRDERSRSCLRMQL